MITNTSTIVSLANYAMRKQFYAVESVIEKSEANRSTTWDRGIITVFDLSDLFLSRPSREKRMVQVFLS